LWLDAKVEKVRDGGRVVCRALVLAYGVHESDYREVIGLDVGECETEAFLRAFLRSLVERGLTGVELVVSDAHAGLKKAIAQVLGCPRQRCSVHFLREALGHVRKDQQGIMAALLSPLFGRRYLSAHSLEAVLDREKKSQTERRPESSPRPEQPMILPTSYTTSWDLTAASAGGPFVVSGSRSIAARVLVLGEPVGRPAALAQLVARVGVSVVLPDAPAVLGDQSSLVARGKL
jgi:Transposase, Mutator family